MRKDFILSLGLISFVVFLDQFTKQSSLATYHLVFNKGFIFGTYSKVPYTLRVTTLCTLFAFLLLGHFILVYILPNKLNSLKYSLSIFLGGVFGNVIDKTIRAQTIDFIPLPLGNFKLVFNLADVAQWVGFILITFFILKKEKILWFEGNQRSTYLVRPKEQILFASKLALATLFSSFMLGLFCFSYFYTLLEQYGVFGRSEVLTYFGLSLFSLSCLLSLVLFVAGIRLSHQTEGPLYAFEKYLERLLGGERAQLALRERDQYKNLEHLADRLDKTIADIRKEKKQ